jgi:hypothetical protein
MSNGWRHAWYEMKYKVRGGDVCVEECYMVK